MSSRVRLIEPTSGLFKIRQQQTTTSGVSLCILNNIKSVEEVFDFNFVVYIFVDILFFILFFVCHKCH